MSAWVDYRKLRETLNFAMVLDHYRVQYKRKGTQVQAYCPLPKHEGHQNSTAFSVSLEKRIFQCFGCGAKGNVLDFVCLMENLNPRDSNEFRRAAIVAQETFSFANDVTPAFTAKAPVKYSPRSQPPTTRIRQQSALVNQPLDFELKNLDTRPPYLLKRGFADRTIAHFGLGYCSKGTFAGRIAIPLHDTESRLIGYAGRLIYDDAVDDQNPKYLFPSKRERNGQALEFAKSLFVYNGHRMNERQTDLIVVQGFTSVWWLWQHGYQNVVALMSSSCTVDQAKIIVNLVLQSGRVWFMTDAGKDGERCAEGLFANIGMHRFCRRVKLSHGQPTDCKAGDLDSMLKWEIHS
jgi:DNA primase